MKNEEISIEAPEGYVIDQNNSDLSQGIIKFKRVDIKDNRFCSWEELGKVAGWYSSELSHICEQRLEREAGKENENIFAEREQAEASLALAQLTQLLKHVNGDWKPTLGWASSSNEAYCIDYRQTYVGSPVNKCLCVRPSSIYAEFLKFGNEEDALKFLEVHRDLIKKAAPLLWGITF